MQVDWFTSPREASQKVNVFNRWSQQLPLKHECLNVEVPIVHQGIKQPGLCAHEWTPKELPQTALSQCGHSCMVLINQDIYVFVLPLSSVDIHPVK